MGKEKILKYIDSQILRINAEIADFFAENLGKKAESELDFVNRVFRICEDSLVNEVDEDESFVTLHLTLKNIFTNKKMFEKVDKMYANLASKTIDKFVLTNPKSNEHEVSRVLKKYQNIEKIYENENFEVILKYIEAEIEKNQNELKEIFDEKFGNEADGKFKTFKVLCENVAEDEVFKKTGNKCLVSDNIDGLKLTMFVSKNFESYQSLRGLEDKYIGLMVEKRVLTSPETLKKHKNSVLKKYENVALKSENQM